MSCIYHRFLVLIFTLFLKIQGGGGQCSPAKEAECEAVWRTCLNEQCGVCFLEINGECYNPNDDQDAVLEMLENCDPTANPECKKSLEDVTDQLLTELGAKDKDVANDGGGQLSKFTQSLTKNDVDASDTEVTEPSKPDETISSAENNDSVGFRSEETPRKTSKLNEKHPVKKHDNENNDDIPDVYFLIIIIACTLSGVAGIALSGYCWYRLHYSDDKVNKTEYIPGRKQNGKSTPSKNGDHKLDYKAEMYHYVHTKNQIAAIEKAKGDLSSGAISNDDDDDDDEGEDYTVYECPGLAPTGDMTVVNPLFSDQEVSVSDEGRAQSNHSSPPSTPSRSNQSPSR